MASYHTHKVQFIKKPHRKEGMLVSASNKGLIIETHVSLLIKTLKLI